MTADGTLVGPPAPYLCCTVCYNWHCDDARVNLEGVVWPSCTLCKSQYLLRWYVLFGTKLMVTPRLFGLCCLRRFHVAQVAHPPPHLPPLRAARFRTARVAQFPQPQTTSAYECSPSPISRSQACINFKSAFRCHQGLGRSSAMLATLKRWRLWKQSAHSESARLFLLIRKARSAAVAGAGTSNPLYILTSDMCASADVHTTVEHPNQEGDT